MPRKAAQPGKPRVLRNFKDSGLGRNFRKGQMPSDLSEGQIANYQAAGLMSDPSAESDA